MTATIQTIDTPDGAFTIVADDRGRVLASGWTADHEAALDPHPPAPASEAVADGETDAAAAALAFYGGDLSAIDGVQVAQDGTADAARRVGGPAPHRTRAPAIVRRVRGRARAAECRAGRGIHLRPQRARAVRALPSRAALRRLARRLRVGPRRQAQPARPRGGGHSHAAPGAPDRYRTAGAFRCIQRTLRYTLEGCRVRATDSVRSHPSGGCHVPGRHRAKTGLVLRVAGITRPRIEG